LVRIFHLARKKQPDKASQPTLLAVWPALLAVVALSWALGLMPWPRLPFPGPDPVPGSYFFYVALLAAPPLARLVAAGLSNHPQAALGVRRQAPLEVARLLPLMLAAVTLPLVTRQVGIPQTPVEGNLASLVCGAVALLVVLTMPWPLWDRDEHDAPLAALGGWSLALFRSLELIELVAQIGLAGVALGASGLFARVADWLAPGGAVVAALVVLTTFEWINRRLSAAAATHRYTRWLFPAALLVAVVGWWVGLGS
jgi:hypothetical protein